MNTVIHPTTGETLYMGRTRAPFDIPRLRFENYAMRNLPVGPRRTNYGPPAARSLSRMYCNDRLSCCVASGLGHVLGVVTANAGDELVLADSDIEKFYGRSGYIPGRPETDQGWNEAVALNIMEREGFPIGGQYSHRIVGNLRIDASDTPLVRSAIYLFENVIYGVEMPNAWIRPFPSASNFTWGVSGAANPENGHCFIGYDYDADERIVKIDTWGMAGSITDAATASYAIPSQYGELHTLLTVDIINRAKTRAPNGFDFSQLLADLESMR